MRSMKKVGRQETLPAHLTLLLAKRYRDGAEVLERAGLNGCAIACCIGVVAGDPIGPGFCRGCQGCMSRI